MKNNIEIARHLSPCSSSGGFVFWTSVLFEVYLQRVFNNFSVQLFFSTPDISLCQLRTKVAGELLPLPRRTLLAGTRGGSVFIISISWKIPSSWGRRTLLCKETAALRTQQWWCISHCCWSLFPSAAVALFARAVWFSQLFLKACQVLGPYLPCDGNTEHCWPHFCSSPVVRHLYPAQRITTVADVCFPERLHSRCLQPAVAAALGAVMYPPGLFSQLFQPIFISSSLFLCCLLSYTDCNMETPFKTCWHCELLTSKWRSIFYDCSLWDFMAGKTICLLLQCLTEATAIICEGSAIFPKSQNKIQPQRGVLSCSMYINPQLPCFKVNQVFHAS